MSMLREIWDNRHLIRLLAERTIKARYRQALLGVFWVAARPLLMMVAFTFLFNTVAELSVPDVPYPVFVFAGIICFEYTSIMLRRLAMSVTSNNVLVSRVYCPRIVLPMSAVLVGSFDLIFMLATMGAVLLVFGVAPSPNIVFLPLIIGLTMILALSIGLWLSAICVWIRDIRFMTTYALRIVMLLTPIGYAASSVPESFRPLVIYNPLALLVDLYRWSILGMPVQSDVAVVPVALTVAVLLVGGGYFFKTLSRTFADVI